MGSYQNVPYIRLSQVLKEADGAILCQNEAEGCPEEPGRNQQQVKIHGKYSRINTMLAIS